MKKSLKKSLKEFWLQHKKIIFGGIVIVVVVVVFLVISLRQYNSYNSNFDKINKYTILDHFFLDHIGGVFTVFIGLVTVFGLYIGIISIQKLRYKEITSYPQFMTRLTNLIENSSGEIKFVCYFVLPGFWQVTDETLKSNFVNALNAKKNRIRMICISEEQHISKMINVAYNGTTLYKDGATPEDLVKFQRKCYVTILSEMTHIETSWENLPTYYFFVTNNRAIIVTPVGLPLLNMENAQDAKSISDKIRLNEDNEAIGLLKTAFDNLEKTKTKETISINTMGFETTDQDVINLLNIEFEKRWKTKTNGK